MNKKILALGAVVVVVAVVAAGWWIFVRDDAPEPLSVGGDDETTEPTGTTPESFDGTWSVGDGSEAGLRITEEFAGGAATNTAVGRSEEVDGSITIAGTQLTEASFTVDLTALEFTDDPPGLNTANRKGAMERTGLETGEFPETTFTLTEPVDIGEPTADGETSTFEVTGDLELHGVTEEITFSVDAEVAGDTIVVASTDPVPVALADYDMTVDAPPFVADVSDEGSFEFRLVLNAP